MSAFTPYKKVVGEKMSLSDGESGAQVSENLKNLLQMYSAAVHSLALRTQPTTEEKGSKFLMKNILKEAETKTDDAQYQASRLEVIVSGMGKGANGHKCLYCGKLYSRKYGLKIHIRTHTGYKPLKCKICQRPFGDPSNLNKHVRLHTQGNGTNAQYRCNQCGKMMVRKRDLDRHLQTRHRNSSVSK